MLPPGTLNALKGHHAGIVSVVMSALAFGAMAAGAPAWQVTVGLAIGLGTYHTRCSARERHEELLARQAFESAVAKLDAVKARHQELLTNDQPLLPLQGGARGTERVLRRRPEQP